MLIVEKNENLLRSLMIENNNLKDKCFIPEAHHSYDDYKKYVFYSIPRCVVNSVIYTCSQLEHFSRKVKDETKKDCLIVFLGQGPKIYKWVFESMMKRCTNPIQSMTLRGSLKDDSVIDLESSIMKYFSKKFNKHIVNKPHVIFVDYVASGSSLQKLGSVLRSHSPWSTNDFTHSYFCLGTESEPKKDKLRQTSPKYIVFDPITIHGADGCDMSDFLMHHGKEIFGRHSAEKIYDSQKYWKEGSDRKPDQVYEILRKSFKELFESGGPFSFPNVPYYLGVVSVDMFNTEDLYWHELFTLKEDLNVIRPIKDV
ncbi:hypothetical protein [Francisella sp. 19X1-34]|uniref:hypothetical protein n=1 Tax=Francisella sp. 19X1-34 TaxID=3087177 RepID=UPI002E36E15F|nr:hypothetical protein [Francisella sp. 19X1-34]MED7789666.1 hypothetical protein [Francisella sp. 19X1-34]